MYPTFRELDLLSYRRDIPIKAGDVIAYPDPDRPRVIVHRVQRLTPEGLATKGDNLPEADPYLVNPATVLGVVRICLRDGRSRRVRGGAAGQVVAARCAIRGQVLRVAAATAGRPYRFMVSRKIPSRWTSSHLDLRMSRYVRHEAEEFQLHHHGRAVGVRRQGEAGWQLHFPYPLFVDPDGLQEPPVADTPPGGDGDR